MILKRLDSSISTFHTITFKKGLNFILGAREKENTNTKDSYNGVGKSLIIELIHFCLASNSVKELKELGNHWCELEFEHNGETHIIRRFFDGTQQCFYNSESISLNKLKDILFEICFEISNSISGISFRSLISRYIRRYKINYSNCFNYVKGEQPAVTLLNNGYLLGIEPQKILNKVQNKELFSQLNSTKKSLQSDPVLIDYFKGQGTIDFKIKDITDKLAKLYVERDNFQVLENFDDLKKKSDNISFQTKQLINQRYILNSRIEKINLVLTKKDNIKIEDVIRLYEDINIQLPSLTVKNIEEVLSFHNILAQKRISTFEKQKEEYQATLDIINSKIQDNEKELSSILEVLSKYGALNDYNLLCKRIISLENELEKTKDYKDLMKKYEKEILLSKKKKAEILIENQDYLESQQFMLDELMNIFRTYSRQFYVNKPSGLTINVNNKDNKIAFDIDADIEGDSSDGINEVKIFCFDLTILMKNVCPINFLFHDSRLLANMDPRQRNIWLRIVSEIFNENSNLQYIVSINEDVLVTMDDVADDSTKELISSTFSGENVRLRLTDKNPESKLLGMQINIRYDK